MKITLDNGRIASMAVSADFLAAFPFLGLTVDKPSCCGRSLRKVADHDSIRKHIAGLPDDQKAKLKKMLQAEFVTMHYHDGSHVREVTF